MRVERGSLRSTGPRRRSPRDWGAPRSGSVQRGGRRGWPRRRPARVRWWGSRGNSFGVETAGDGGADLAFGLVRGAAGGGQDVERGALVDGVDGDHPRDAPGRAVQGAAPFALRGVADRVQVRGEQGL